MPNVVLMAKSVYVWLHQISRSIGREVTRLDEIPDGELDRLAAWGFTGLWLIGLWERSGASREIKRRTGNPEAEASAYSIYDYEIAADLGGEEALENLKARAWQRGIRLAGDMVPNHMGIYSRWTVEHPERFLSRPAPPFPWYSFTGPDLSGDPRVSMFLEDRYWDRGDAAVVWKRVDNRTGEVSYVYHGNDGTGMPWNDTAQLDFLKAEVRAAVVETVLCVARKFPIIRFDAAMTLTRRHFRRLWYPAPGEGGAIPTRAEYSLGPGEFEGLFPGEFWRDVVDAVAARAPDTLLLAEAFWLMEGYFVRTLGMHRVYNSAFMNMLKLEDNARYRQVILNVLDFDPEILRRFVNFMNNPDEDTAVEGFGTGDKYFGVATLLVTLPGLPLFGHGQIEGFREKYGMEYRRAYRDETPDTAFVERHERQIFPLLRRRALFSGVEKFVLYDFENPDGSVNHDVFAYSNRFGAERALVVYNNRYAEARGRVLRAARGEAGLGKALGLADDPEVVYDLHDAASGLHYLAGGAELVREGLGLHLGAFKVRVFLGFQELRDPRSRRLRSFLGDRGVASLPEALLHMHLARVREKLREAFASFPAGAEGAPAGEANVFLACIEEAGRECAEMSGRAWKGATGLSNLKALLGELGRRARTPDLDLRQQALPLLGAEILRILRRAGEGVALPAEVEGFGLDEVLGGSAPAAEVLALFPGGENLLGAGRFGELFRSGEARRFLGVNLHDGTEWFVKERMEELVSALLASAAMGGPERDIKELVRAAEELLAAGERSRWRAEEFLGILRGMRDSEDE
jgi:glycosidase